MSGLDLAVAARQRKLVNVIYLQYTSFIQSRFIKEIKQRYVRRLNIWKLQERNICENHETYKEYLTASNSAAFLCLCVYFLFETVAHVTWLDTARWLLSQAIY